MPEALTYSSLVSDVQLYAERNDVPFTNQIPRFIMLAENRIASEIHGLGYLRAVTFDLTDGDSTYEKPARWRETVSLSLTSGTQRRNMYPRQYSYLRSYWPDASLKDEPMFYSDYDYEHWLIVPTPNATYTAEVMYHERPLPLSDENQTNWTTQYAPQLLLYATLLEAQPFLKRAERIQEFQALFDRAAEALQKENGIRQTDRSMRS